MHVISLPSPDAVRRLSIPASSFGIVLGLNGISSCWRVAHTLWGVPMCVSDIMFTFTTIVWLSLLIGFVGKWLFQRTDAIAEVQHPVHCCYLSLVPISGLLIGSWVYTWSATFGVTLVSISCVGQLAFSAYRSGALLRGDRQRTDTTAVLYLPTVGGNFVSAIALTTIGHADVAAIFFGAGMFAWLALESTLLVRLYNCEPLPPDLRPTMGLQLAPSVVGAVAYLAVSNGHVDLFFMGLYGYGMLQALLLLRLTRWLMQTGFTPSYWSFSFGVTAIALACLQSTAASPHTMLIRFAIPLFAFANLFVSVLVLGTLRLLLHGRLFMK
jgi:tellurite resistance protein